MDKNILNTLKPGEHLVEMQECSLHNRTVIEVTIYTKRRLFGCKKYTYPFYFDNKKIAENFLKYRSFFGIYEKHPSYMSWNEDKFLYLKLENSDHNALYVMVDDYQSHNYGVRYQLKRNGIWAGEINDDEQLYMEYKHNKSFMEIFNFADIGLKNNKTYVFKMIEN